MDKFIYTVDTDVVVFLIGQFKNITKCSFVGGICDWNYFVIIASILFAETWDRRNHAASHHFTYSQDVIPHLLLLVKPRRQHGIPGMLMQMSILLFFIMAEISYNEVSPTAQSAPLLERFTISCMTRAAF